MGEVAAAADGLSKSGAIPDLVAAAQPNAVITERIVQSAKWQQCDENYLRNGERTNIVKKGLRSDMKANGVVKQGKCAQMEKVGTIKPQPHPNY